MFKKMRVLWVPIFLSAPGALATSGGGREANFISLGESQQQLFPSPTARLPQLQPQILDISAVHMSPHEEGPLGGIIEEIEALHTKFQLKAADRQDKVTLAQDVSAFFALMEKQKCAAKKRLEQEYPK